MHRNATRKETWEEEPLLCLMSVPSATSPSQWEQKTLTQMKWGWGGGRGQVRARVTITCHINWWIEIFELKSGEIFSLIRVWTEMACFCLRFSSRDRNKYLTELVWIGCVPITLKIYNSVNILFSKQYWMLLLLLKGKGVEVICGWV